MRNSCRLCLISCFLAALGLHCGGDATGVSSDQRAYQGQYNLESDPHPIESPNPRVSRAYVYDGDTEVGEYVGQQSAMRALGLGLASAKTSGWLSTKKNKIYRADGTLYMGRGVNLFDTRACNGCTMAPPNNAEVLRRIDAVFKSWSGDLIRLNMHSYSQQSGRVQWQNVLSDAGYLKDLVATAQYVLDKYPGKYILLALTVDPSFDAHGIPNQGSEKVWTKLATAFLKFPNVMFGIANEPHALSTDTQAIINAQGGVVFQAMTKSVNAIRKVEDAAKSPHHLIAVQGTTGWARNLAYYITHPIKSDNIVYETHPYDKPDKWAGEFLTAAKTLPVLVGEFGMVTEYENSMGLNDAYTMMNTCDKLSIPYIGWAMSATCGIPLLQKTFKGDCGIDSLLVPTSWARVLISHMRAMQGRAPNVAAPSVGSLTSVRDNSLCVFDPGYGGTSTVDAVLQSCDFSNQAATIKINATAHTLSVGTGRRCLQVAAGGNNVQVAPCNGSAAQKLDYNSGQILAPSKLCLYAPAGLPVPAGKALRMSNCTNQGKAFWQIF